MRDDHQSLGDTSQNSADSDGTAVWQNTLQLRVLATTDVHMQFLGHDYIRDQPLEHHGLAGLATLINETRAQARAEGMSCLLFDNGDLLQGAPLGDTCAQTPVTNKHPVVRCLDTLRYDAIGLGNHDLDHGLDYPKAIAAVADVPVVATNLTIFDQNPFARDVILNCQVPGGEGVVPDTLRVGVISVLPDRTAQWNKASLSGAATVHPPKAALEEAVRRLRNKGADIVILLAHLGVESAESIGVPAHDAVDLAQVAGIDAVIAGHTHRRLPGPDHAGLQDVDEVKGTLAQRPAAMPGFDASDLAVLDLTLSTNTSGRWKVQSFKTALRANTKVALPDPAIAGICMPFHSKTRSDLAQHIGHTPTPLHNFFSLAKPTKTTALLARAKMHVVRNALAGTSYAALPLLAATPAHTAGGRAGPDHFLHIKTGPVLRRHLTGLSPFANEICALHLSGADLRNWLEHTFSVYHRLAPQKPEQPLIHADRPTFDFDTIFGVQYTVDPTRAQGQRLTSLKYAESDVADAQEFILVTNLFRAAGGGGGSHFPDTAIVHHAQTTISAALQALLSSPDLRIPTVGGDTPWRFDVPANTSAILRTSPEALPYLDDIADLSPAFIGLDKDGFAAIRLTL